MPNLSSDDRFADKDKEGVTADANLVADEDMLMEQILENISTTPIGQVLKRISSLPEVRMEKILTVRRQLTEGRYNLNERLDVTLEKVLEALTR
jgi:hypothetical protein